MIVEMLQNCGEKEPSCSLQPLVSSLIPCTQSSICLWTSSPMQKRLACFSKVFATRNKYNPSVINFASQEEKPSVSFLILITQSSICLWTSSPRNPSTCFEKKIATERFFLNPFTNNLSFLFSIPNPMHLGFNWSLHKQSQKLLASFFKSFCDRKIEDSLQRNKKQSSQCVI